MSERGPVEVGATVLGRYRLDAVLGAGAVGVVYAATDLRLARPVAIKFLGRNAEKFRGARKRLEREAQALAGVTHPNLVTVLDFDLIEDDTPAMVMEHIDGVSLKRLLESHQFPARDAALVLYQALGALAACHDRGIVHRDLKPGNILIERRGPHGVHVKIIDFGIAQMLSDDGATALTLSGEVYGSPRYMAPEQWHQEAVDGRTDVYALGLIGYAMLAGDAFVTARNPVDCWKEHVNPVRPRLVRTATGEVVPPPLAEAIHQAMQVRPADRFPSARAMQAVLAPLVGNVRPSLPTDAPAWSPGDSVEEGVAHLTGAVKALGGGDIDATMMGGGHPFEAGDDDDDFDDDATCIDEPEPAPPPKPTPFITELEQPSQVIDQTGSVRPREVAEPVRYDGRLGTAITKEDFERALEADRAERAERESSRAPAAAPPLEEIPTERPAAPVRPLATVRPVADPPPARPASPRPLPRPAARNTAPVPAPSPPPARRPLWLWIAGGVVLGLIAVGAVLIFQ